jgi:hypothetical protein
MAQGSSRELSDEAGLGSRGLTNVAGAWAQILDDNLCVALLERCLLRAHLLTALRRGFAYSAPVPALSSSPSAG